MKETITLLALLLALPVAASDNAVLLFRSTTGTGAITNNHSQPVTLNSNLTVSGSLTLSRIDGGEEVGMIIRPDPVYIFHATNAATGGFFGWADGDFTTSGQFVGNGALLGTNTVSDASSVLNGVTLENRNVTVPGTLTAGTISASSIVNFGATNVNVCPLETPNVALGYTLLFVTNAAYNITGFLGASNNMQVKASIIVSNSAATPWSIGLPTGTRGTNSISVAAGKWTYASIHLIPGQMTNAIVGPE